MKTALAMFALVGCSFVVAQVGAEDLAYLNRLKEFQANTQSYPGPVTSLFNGAKLLKLCEDDKYLCAIYIAGVRDGQAPILRSIKADNVCPPATATPEQFSLISQKWITEHPEFMHNSAPDLIWLALKDAFPCPAR